jgi:hypothetical protein
LSIDFVDFISFNLKEILPLAVMLLAILGWGFSRKKLGQRQQGNDDFTVTEMIRRNRGGK